MTINLNLALENLKKVLERGCGKALQGLNFSSSPKNIHNKRGVKNE